MKNEHADLTSKLKALNAFIYENAAFLDLDLRDQARMIQQAGFMESYESVLEHRIWLTSCSKTLRTKLNRLA
jgi:hypothetical protein